MVAIAFSQKQLLFQFRRLPIVGYFDVQIYHDLNELPYLGRYSRLNVFKSIFIDLIHKFVP